MRVNPKIEYNIILRRTLSKLYGKWHEYNKIQKSNHIYSGGILSEHLFNNDAGSLLSVCAIYL